MCGEEEEGDGLTRQEEEEKTKEVYECFEGRRADDGCNERRRRRQREVETDDPLLRPLTEAAKRRKRSFCMHGRRQEVRGQQLYCATELMVKKKDRLTTPVYIMSSAAVTADFINKAL